MNERRKLSFFSTEISPILWDMDYAETRRNAENLTSEVAQKVVEIKTLDRYYS